LKGVEVPRWRRIVRWWYLNFSSAFLCDSAVIFLSPAFKPPRIVRKRCPNVHICGYL